MILTVDVLLQLSVNLFVDYMALALNPIHASVKKAGMEGTAINVSGTNKI